MKKAPSGSNAEAFLMCGASHALPQSDSHNDAMYRGSEGHDPLAAAINKRAPRTTPRGLKLVEHFPLEKVLAGVGLRKAETAYAVNVKTKTSRYIGVDIDRNYGPLEKYEIPTTIDVEGFKDGVPFVRDWKFGKTSSWVQLLIHGMAMAFRSGAPAPEVDAGFVLIDGTIGGREYDDKDARILSLEELDVAADRLVVAWDRVEAMADVLARGEPVAVTEGAWCTFCGAYPYCPAKTRLVRNLVHEIATDEMVAALTVEQCGKAWAKLQEIRRLSERMYDALTGRADKEPLPLPNGKRLAMVAVNGRTTFDVKGTRQLLAELGATEAQIRQVMKKGMPYTQPKEMSK